MEKAILIRNYQSDQGTFGHLVTGEFRCRTIELPWRDNSSRISRIPAGIYTCELYESPRHGPVYLLQNVPNRSMIEIHVGNFAGDIHLGFTSDFLGCIGLGEKRGKLWTGQGTGRQEQQAILNSQVTVESFISYMGREQFELEIIEAYSQKEAA